MMVGRLLSFWVSVTFQGRAVKLQMGSQIGFLQGSGWQKKIFETTRWAPSSCKWTYNPYKWPYKWLTVLITLVVGVINPFITGRGPTLHHLIITFLNYTTTWKWNKNLSRKCDLPLFFSKRAWNALQHMSHLAFGDSPRGVCQMGRMLGCPRNLWSMVNGSMGYFAYKMGLINPINGLING